MNQLTQAQLVAEAAKAGATMKDLREAQRLVYRQAIRLRFFDRMGRHCHKYGRVCWVYHPKFKRCLPSGTDGLNKLQIRGDLVMIWVHHKFVTLNYRVFASSCQQVGQGGCMAANLSG
jgi:hypothetical protein